MKTPIPEEPCVLIAAYDKQVVWQRFRQPRGKEECYLLFGATKEPSVIFPVSNDGKVIAVVHYRHGAQQKLLELPGGSSKRDDSPEKVAKEELREETGYKCSKISRLDATGIWFDPASVRVRFYPFLAIGCKKTQRWKQEKHEQVEPKPIPVRKWFRMIAEGKICDANSIAISLLVLPRLNSDLRREALAGIITDGPMRSRYGGST